MIRLLHFSDPHLDGGLADASPVAFANKRALGLANLLLRRRRHFEGARATIDALASFAEAQDVDFVLCTGDYTALGTRAELEDARRAIEPLTRRRLGFATVPGNHDLYVDDGPGVFESLFAEGLRSDLEPWRWSEGAPYVRLVGDALAIVGLGSARPNSLIRSSGEVPPAQLEALRAIAGDARLAGRFVIVALHYAPRLWDGRPDTALHGLDNHEALIEAARGLRFGAIVFGHVHHGYHLSVPGLVVPLVGAGSSTYVGRESAWLWEIEAGRASATQLAYVAGGWRALEAPGLRLLPS